MPWILQVTEFGSIVTTVEFASTGICQ